jgi:hypothetical protein
MSVEQNKAVLRREVEELYNHTGDLDVVEEIFSPEYVSHEPTSGEVRGIEGARRFAATFREAFPRPSEHHRGHGGRRGQGRDALQGQWHPRGRD